MLVVHEYYVYSRQLSSAMSAIVLCRIKLDLVRWRSGAAIGCWRQRYASRTSAIGLRRITGRIPTRGRNWARRPIAGGGMGGYKTRRRSIARRRGVAGKSIRSYETRGGIVGRSRRWRGDPVLWKGYCFAVNERRESSANRRRQSTVASLVVCLVSELAAARLAGHATW